MFLEMLVRIENVLLIVPTHMGMVLQDVAVPKLNQMIYVFALTLVRVRLVHCNGYYTIIRISITMNGITITIHFFFFLKENDRIVLKG